MRDAYNNFSGYYQSTHQGASNEDASAYALLQIFGSGITLLKSPSGTNSFRIVTLDNNGTVTITVCN